jgi:hypothetical protein
VRLADGDASTARGDQAIVLPRAERAADGEERGARHLREVLSREREVNLHASFDAASRMLRQAQQGARDSAVHPFGHELPMLFLEFVETSGDHPGRVDCNRRKAVHERGDARAVPCVRLAGFEGPGSDWIRAGLGKGGNAAERFARSNDPQDDFMSFS